MAWTKVTRKTVNTDNQMFVEGFFDEGLFIGSGDWVTKTRAMGTWTNNTRKTSTWTTRDRAT